LSIEFADSAGKSVYILHIQLTSIVENVEDFHVGCGAVWAVQVGPHNKGTSGALGRIESFVPRFVAAKSQLRNLKRNNSHIISDKVVKTIPSEMDTIRKRLGELEERISKIDKLDKLEARVRSLEEKLQKKR
jgi:hypothetical protein